MSQKIRFVVATRCPQEDFFEKTATGRTLGLYESPEIALDLYPSNQEGLPVVYNRSIARSDDDQEVLVFAHDDIYLTDFYWVGQLMNALNHFDIVGVAGNKRRVPHQPSWAALDEHLHWDSPDNLSGIVGHGSGFPDVEFSIYGTPCKEVKLLDGVFIACRKKTLNDFNLRFDERFDFDFYDLDFCRQAEQSGARMGTWCISLIHQSLGDLTTERWQSARSKYFEKWGD